MASAAVMGGIGMGASALGSLFGAGGSIAAGEAQQQMNNYQASIALMNAKVAKQNETYARNVGEIQAQNAGLQAAQVEGQTKAAEASSGLDVNSGSAKQVQESQAKVTSLNLDQIRSNAAKTAYNFDVQSAGFEDQANLFRMAGANAAEAGEIGAVSSIVGGASSVATQWSKASQVGLFSNNGGMGG